MDPNPLAVANLAVNRGDSRVPAMKILRIGQ